MHPVRDSTEPIVVSVNGTLNLAEGMHDAICSSEIEEDGAFGRFYGVCAALCPQNDAEKMFEAHEGFWQFAGEDTPRMLHGELAWFQVEHLGRVPPLQLVPLFVHAAIDTVGQLGDVSVSSVRVQVPEVNTPVDHLWMQALLDQFAGTSGLSSPVPVQVSIFTPRLAHFDMSGVSRWFDETHTGDVTLRKLEEEAVGVEFDDRWALGSVRAGLHARFDVPEWSAASASTLAIFMLEAVRAGKVAGPAVVEVGRVDSFGATA